jgi:hypothetical protein
MIPYFCRIVPAICDSRQTERYSRLALLSTSDDLIMRSNAADLRNHRHYDKDKHESYWKQVEEARSFSNDASFQDASDCYYDFRGISCATACSSLWTGLPFRVSWRWRIFHKALRLGHCFCKYHGTRLEQCIVPACPNMHC